MRLPKPASYPSPLYPSQFSFAASLWFLTIRQHPKLPPCISVGQPELDLSSLVYKQPTLVPKVLCYRAFWEAASFTGSYGVAEAPEVCAKEGLLVE